MVAYAWGRNSFILGTVLLLGGLASGCASIEGYPRRLEYSDQYVTEVGNLLSPAAIAQYNSTIDPGALAIIRNNIVTARIFSIDANYHDFVRELTTQQNLSTLGVDWAAIGLASAGTVTGSASAKAVMAAISAGLLGAKASVDKELYYNRTIAALITLMDGQRKNIVAQIYAGLKKSPYDYTLYQGLADLDNYYNAGSINGALTGLTVTAGASSQDGDEQVAAVLTSSFVFDDSSQKLRKFWKPDGKINVENQTKILNWMKANKLSGEKISYFMYSKDYAAARAKAVKDLNVQ